MNQVPRVRAAKDFDVIEIDPAHDPLWEAMLAADGAGLFHAPPWLGVLSDAYGFEPRAYVAIDASNQPRGGVAFCVIDDAVGRRVVSLPFSDACDPLMVTLDAWPRLFAALCRHGAPVHMRCLDSRLPQSDRKLTVTKRARWHTLSVANKDLNGVGFAASTRRAIRKAEQSGVVVRPLETSEGVAEFHRLHVRLRKQKYGLLAQPLAFFEAIRRRFEAVDGFYPLGAFLGEQLIAATIFLRWGDTLYYKFNASSPVSLAARPNDLLVSAGIALAQSLGCSKLDLGPSDDDQPGLIRFKRQFGAAERELRFVRYLPAGEEDRRSVEMRKLLGDMARMFVSPDVPDDVTAEAGARLYRLFA